MVPEERLYTNVHRELGTDFIFGSERTSFRLTDVDH